MGQPNLFSEHPAAFDGDAFGRHSRTPRIADNPSPSRANGDVRRRPRGAELVGRLLDVLDNRGWVAARTLAAELDTDDRAIREAANRSGGRVIGGQHGYIRTEQASLREVQRVIRFLLGQANRMRRRVMEIEAVLHRKGAA